MSKKAAEVLKSEFEPRLTNAIFMETGQIHVTATYKNPKSHHYCPNFVKLLEHPLTAKHIPATGPSQLFYIEGTNDKGQTVCKSVKGITRILSRIFTPNYDFSVAAPMRDDALKASLGTLVFHQQRFAKAWTGRRETMRNRNRASTTRRIVNGEVVTERLVSAQEKRRGVVSKGKKKPKLAGKNFRESAGLVRGKRVHEEIEYLVLQGPEAYFLKYHEPMPHVEQIMKQLFVLGLTPVAAEFPIYHNRLCIGTKVDMVCKRNSDHSLVLVELKTVSNIEALTRYFGKMEAPFEDVTDNRLYQAVIQLGFCLALVSTLYNIDVHAGYVICADADNSVSINVGDMGWFTRKYKEFQVTINKRCLELNLVGAGSEFYVKSGTKRGGAKRAPVPKKRQKGATGEDVGPARDTLSTLNVNGLFAESDDDDDDGDDDFDPLETSASEQGDNYDPDINAELDDLFGTSGSESEDIDTFIETHSSGKQLMDIINSKK